MFAEVSSDGILTAFHSRNETYKKLVLKTIFQNETDYQNGANSKSSAEALQYKTLFFLSHKA